MEKDVETVLTYPMESDEWVETVAIGGVASLLSFLILPYFAVLGYLVRAIRAGMEGADRAPVFDEWETLLKEGLVAGVIAFAYQLVPIVVFFVLVGGSMLALLSGSEAGAGVGLFGLLAGMVVSWLLAIVFGYLGMAGIANYAREGSLGAGFDFDVISDVVFERAYAVAWGYVILLNLGVGMVVGFLNAVPILGSIVGVFVSFYALIIAGWIWGDGFAEAAGTARTTHADAPAAGAGE